MFDVATPQEERDAALAAYRLAQAEFDAAQAGWDPFLDFGGEVELDSAAAEAAFDRLAKANQARQDAVDALWLAWRNRPDHG